MKYGIKANKLFIFLVLLIFAMETCIAGSGLADSVSIFVATDRHDHYETITDKEDIPAESEEIGKDKPEMPSFTPVFDESGHLIWHNQLTEVLKLVSQDNITPEFILIGGDNVGEGGDNFRDETGYPMGMPPFSMKGVDAQVCSVFGEEARTLYTYGSHDVNAVDEYTDVFFSGPVTGSGYYIYGITFAQMIFDTDEQAAEAHYAGKDAEDPRGLSAQTASHHFLAWVKSLKEQDDHQPIIVISHVPLHAHRGDNLGAWTWTRALNDAAEDHDIIFLWGHNHTTERGKKGKTAERGNYLHLPGDELIVGTWEPDAEGKPTGKRLISDKETQPVSQAEKLRFIYINAGYLINGVGSVLTFSGEGRWEQVEVKRYALTEDEFAEPWSYPLRQF